MEVNHSNVTAINEVMLQNGYKIHKKIHNIDIIYVKTWIQLLWMFYSKNTVLNAVHVVSLQYFGIFC